MIESIYQTSSFAKCLRRGFAYVFKNPWLITRVMGPWALALSIVMVLYYSLLLSSGKNIIEKGMMADTNWSMIGFVYLLVCIMGLLCISRLFIFFRRNQLRIEREEAIKMRNEGEEVEKKAVKKLTLKDRVMEILRHALYALPYVIWSFIFTGVMMFGSVGIMEWVMSIQSHTTLAFIGIAFIVALCCACVFALPLCYTFYSTMMNNGEGSFLENYRIGFKYKRKTFGIYLMSGFLVMLFCIIPSIPLCVPYLAFSASIKAELLYNDPVAIPTSGYVLMVIVSVVAATVCNLMSIASYTSLLYLYGSIKTEQKQ